jgi:hypothetical protein
VSSRRGPAVASLARRDIGGRMSLQSASRDTQQEGSIRVWPQSTARPLLSTAAPPCPVPVARLGGQPIRSAGESAEKLAEAAARDRMTSNSATSGRAVWALVQRPPRAKTIPVLQYCWTQVARAVFVDFFAHAPRPTLVPAYGYARSPRICAHFLHSNSKILGSRGVCVARTQRGAHAERREAHATARHGSDGSSCQHELTQRSEMCLDEIGP